MSAAANDLTFRLGESFGPEQMSITNADGSPANLTGATLTLVVRELDGATDLLTRALALVEPPTAGKATLTLAATGANSVASLAALA